MPACLFKTVNVRKLRTFCQVFLLFCLKLKRTFFREFYVLHFLLSVKARCIRIKFLLLKTKKQNYSLHSKDIKQAAKNYLKRSLNELFKYSDVCWLVVLFEKCEVEKNQH